MRYRSNFGILSNTGKWIGDATTSGLANVRGQIKNVYDGTGNLIGNAGKSLQGTADNINAAVSAADNPNSLRAAMLSGAGDTSRALGGFLSDNADRIGTAGITTGVLGGGALAGMGGKAGYDAIQRRRMRQPGQAKMYAMQPASVSNFVVRGIASKATDLVEAGLNGVRKSGVVDAAVKNAEVPGQMALDLGDAATEAAKKKLNNRQLAKRVVIGGGIAGGTGLAGLGASKLMSPKQPNANYGRGYNGHYF
jgi:hypothetical protein